MSAQPPTTFRPSSQPVSAPRRPLSIAELADRALTNLWDPSKSLKQWLKAADGFRKAGRQYAEAGDYEAAFVEFAKAATIILEKIPTHKEYLSLLTPTQRYNLGLNGQDILEYLGKLKPILVDRYEHWVSRHGTEMARFHANTLQSAKRPNEYRNHVYADSDDRTRGLDQDPQQPTYRLESYIRDETHNRYRTTSFGPASPANTEGKGRENEVQRSNKHDGKVAEFWRPPKQDMFRRSCDDAVPPPMPLESPNRDSARKPQAAQPSTHPLPTTTTSLPPDSHPQMSQHQREQGYTPSLHSMFNHTSFKLSNVASSALLLIPDSNHDARSRLPYPSLPRYHQDVLLPNRTPSQESARIVRDKVTADRIPDLKTVLLPRNCLPRFLSIAALNTERNRETCGLLLGKDQMGKFAVTVLLVPKQRSTSDTCTMEEEELVMHFTEERSLITLGWIHTHPSQSCFMSSVDLHTHAGFQRMLPESFAVVCAPKSTPNFGIFRLTDPPGLQTVLRCDEKEAFHYHPDLPIYTDADKGHVQMKDLDLEIVDLR